jgi:hypothetical protein
LKVLFPGLDYLESSLLLPSGLAQSRTKRESKN